MKNSHFKNTTLLFVFCVSAKILFGQSLMVSTLNQYACDNNCWGKISAHASGGITPYTYNWSNGQTTSIVTGLCPGTYTITVIDAANSTATSITKYPSDFIITLELPGICPPPDSCTIITNSFLGGMPPYTYLWTIIPPATIAGSSTVANPLVCLGTLINNNTVDTIINYGTVKLTDSLGCSVTSRMNLLLRAPFINITPAIDTICVGNSTTLTALVGPNKGWGYFNYVWSPGGQTTTSITVSPTVTTTYEVSAIDGYTYCKDSASARIIVTPCTGISDLPQSDFRIDIFPNPFSSATTLYTDKIYKHTILTVYNSIGEQVKQIKNIDGHTLIFSRDNLPCGLYFLRFTEDNKIFPAHKVVIVDN